MFDYVAGKQDWLAHGLPAEGEETAIPTAGSRADRDVPTCSLTDRIGGVRERVEAAGSDVCVVVNEERVVLGLLRRKALHADPDNAAEDVMELGPSTFRPNVSVAEMSEYFAEHDLESAPITTSAGVLIGLLRRVASGE